MKKTLALWGLLAALLVGGPAWAAFSATSKGYPLRTTGNVRTFVVADSGATTGRATGVYLTSPTAIYVEMYPAGTVAAYGFNGDTVTVQYSTDNATWANLATSSIACTAACTAWVSATDVKSGYFTVNLTGAGTGYAVVVNLISVGSTDSQ